MLKKLLGFLLFTPETVLYLLNLALNWNRARKQKESALKLKVNEVEFYGSYMDVGKVTVSYQSVIKPIKIKNGWFSTSIIIGKGKNKRKVYASKMPQEEREAIEQMLNTVAEINEYKKNDT